MWKQRSVTFRSAIAAARDEISTIAAKLEDRLQPEELALFDAYLHMLDDSVDQW